MPLMVKPDLVSYTIKHIHVTTLVADPAWLESTGLDQVSGNCNPFVMEQ